MNDIAQVLQLIKKRSQANKRKGSSLYPASSHVSALIPCLQDGSCELGIKDLASFQDSLKELDSRLAWSPASSRILAKRMHLREGVQGESAPTEDDEIHVLPATPGAIMDVEYIMTTSDKDREGDILEPEGAEIDEAMPFLWQHLPEMPIGKLVRVTYRDKKIIKCHSAIADTPLGRDAAVLFEFGALRISHGFVPLEADPIDPRDPETGFHIKRYKVLESSGVSIPANPGATVEAASRGKLFHPAVKAFAASLRAKMPKMVTSGYSGGIAHPSGRRSTGAGAVPPAPSPGSHLTMQNAHVLAEKKRQQGIINSLARALAEKEIQEQNQKNVTPRTKAFDVAAAPLEPASLAYDWISRYLGVPVKNIFTVARTIQPARMGSWLTGLKEALKGAALLVEDVRNIDYRGTEEPPYFKTIQLNSEKKDNFLIDGYAFMRSDDPALPHVVVRSTPTWFGGVEVQIFADSKNTARAVQLYDDATQWAQDNNFLKGEAFSVSGEFLPKTEETFADLFLEPVNEKAVNRVATRMNAKGKEFKNYGMIFAGPPGTGKTLSGRILRNLTNATFVWVSARDFHSFGSYGGLQEAWDLAKELAPAIVFIEDVDNWLDRYTVDYVKTEMDGIARSSGVLTILTSNFPEQLPEALIDRPGRFHDVLYFGLPGDKQRSDMLEKWLPGMDPVEKRDAVKQTDGLAGAHIYHLCAFAKDLEESEGKSRKDSFGEALRKVKEQRELINGVQLQGSRYRPTKSIHKGSDAMTQKKQHACGGKGGCNGGGCQGRTRGTVSAPSPALVVTLNEGKRPVSGSMKKIKTLLHGKEYTTIIGKLVQDGPDVELAKEFPALAWTAKDVREIVGSTKEIRVIGLKNTEPAAKEMTTCPFCDGAGVNPGHGTNCEACGGTGQVDVQKGAKAVVAATCPGCGHTANYESTDEWAQCAGCGDSFTIADGTKGAKIRRVKALSKKKQKALNTALVCVQQARGHDTVKDADVPQALLEKAENSIKEAMDAPKTDEDETEEGKGQKAPCGACNATGQVWDIHAPGGGRWIECPRCAGTGDTNGYMRSTDEEETTEEKAVLLLADIMGGKCPSWETMHALKKHLAEAIVAQDEKAAERMALRLVNGHKYDPEWWDAGPVDTDERFDCPLGSGRVSDGMCSEMEDSTGMNTCRDCGATVDEMEAAFSRRSVKEQEAQPAENLENPETSVAEMTEENPGAMEEQEGVKGVVWHQVTCSKGHTFHLTDTEYGDAEVDGGASCPRCGEMVPWDNIKSADLDAKNVKNRDEFAPVQDAGQWWVISLFTSEKFGPYASEGAAQQVADDWNANAASRRSTDTKAPINVRCEECGHVFKDDTDAGIQGPAATIEPHCPKCGNDGTAEYGFSVVSTEADAKELTACPFCDGTGTNASHGTECQACNGTGQVDIASTDVKAGLMEPCADCNGTGLIEGGPHGQECPTCGGIGEVQSDKGAKYTEGEEEWDECKVCRGRGLDANGEHCPNCLGDGAVWAGTNVPIYHPQPQESIDYLENIRRDTEVKGQYYRAEEVDGEWHVVNTQNGQSVDGPFDSRSEAEQAARDWEQDGVTHGPKEGETETPEDEEETEDKAGRELINCPGCNGTGKRNGKDCILCEGIGMVYSDTMQPRSGDAETPEDEEEKGQKWSRDEAPHYACLDCGRYWWVGSAGDSFDPDGPQRCPDCGSMNTTRAKADDAEPKEEEEETEEAKSGYVVDRIEGWQIIEGSGTEAGSFFTVDPDGDREGPFSSLDEAREHISLSGERSANAEQKSV